MADFLQGMYKKVIVFKPAFQGLKHHYQFSFAIL